MNEHAQPPGCASDRTGLSARVLGIFISPRETFAGVIVRPRWFDVALVTTVVAIVATAGFLVTDVGRLAVLDQQVGQTESLGIAVTDQMYARLEGMQRYMPYLTGGGILVGWPLGWLVLSGILVAVFNGALGGEATFRQVFAVVVHSSVVRALQAAFVAPLNYARESTGGATSLGVLFPMLGEGSFPARLLGGIDLFTVWWIVVLSMGLSVLYQKRTGSIAVWFLSLYAMAAVAIAAIQTIRGGV